MELEILGLAILVVGLIIASIIDIKIKEVPNWLSFGLIFTGLFFALLTSLQSSNATPFLQSLKTLGIFIVVGYFLYFTKQWGGGDVRLLWAIGTFLPIYPAFLLSLFKPNLNIGFIWVLLVNILLVWFVYSLAFSLYLGFKNKKQVNKDLKTMLNQNKKPLLYLALLFLIGSLLSFLFLPSPLSFLGAIILFFPIFFVFVVISLKSIEKMSLIKRIPVSKVREGDWVFEKITINQKTVYKPTFEGINKKQLEQLKKSSIRNITIKEGMPFVPALTLAIIISLIFGNIVTYILP